MVSFQCESCGDVLTKKKLDTHANRCWNASYTCIDCMTHFQGYDYKKHTSCISEAQKYQGALYREKKPKSQQNGQAPSQSVSKVEVPPPAPSPPAAAYPVNVFDYLVNEESPATGGTTQHSSSGVRYGAGPVERSLDRFDSDLAGGTQTQESGLGYSTTLRTPGASHSNGLSGDKHSEKKRKRAQAEELLIVPPQTVAHPAAQLGLHSGLTGGLNRMLSNEEPRGYEASPLSPKKRNKHSKEEKALKKRTDDDEDRHHKKHRHHDAETRSRSGREIKVIEGGAELKSIEYPLAKRRSDESNSEFFLGLINRDHLSSKGQSIWGALKMFRDGLPGDVSNKDVKEHEEKKLFRGLRMRVNDAGEIVLFSRPDLETSGSSGMELTKR